ncbi:protein MAIN-LIKE 1-like [Tripterygium wilfordii]|uniref:protein MAIN-LIKE 1-like n=1 Tax=Tripterygium wilfordii TaxID=458696 RepID=UPI0018F7EBCE|nr:protein MAIN-LIKE 1-like [Tripterygium wilfordii]
MHASGDLRMGYVEMGTHYSCKLWVSCDSYEIVGFYGVTQIAHIKLNHGLLAALAERWRHETVGDTRHTHFIYQVVRRRSHYKMLLFYWDLESTGQLLLGVGRISGIRHFGHLNPPPVNALDEVLQCYARAYIMAMFGSILFTSTTGDNIPLMFLPLLEDLQATRDFSWGGVVLGCLYRNLCRRCMQGMRQMGGCVLLLQATLALVGTRRAAASSLRDAVNDAADDVAHN